MSAVVVTVIVLVVAMIVGPIAMMRPSASQQRRDALRLKARELGLGVTFRKIPARATDTGTPDSVPVYTLVCKGGPSWLLVRTDYAHEVHIFDWWQSVGEAVPASVLAYLESAIAVLPADVVAFGAQSSQLVIYWRERGDAGSVAAIAQFLKGLAQVQVSRPVAGD